MNCRTFNNKADALQSIEVLCYLFGLDEERGVAVLEAAECLSAGDEAAALERLNGIQAKVSGHKVVLPRGMSGASVCINEDGNVEVCTDAYWGTRVIGRKLAALFERVPPRADIPEVEGLRPEERHITWRIGDVTIRTSKGTMGRVWAAAEDDDGFCYEAYASNHKAAVRALIREALRYYG